MKAQTVNTQIQKAFNLKSVPFQQVNNYSMWDSYGHFYFNIVMLDKQSFKAAALEGTYYHFSLEMLEDKMCLSMELDRSWVDKDGVTHEEELMNYCEELPYSKEGINEFKTQLKAFSVKATKFSMAQIKDKFLSHTLQVL